MRRPGRWRKHARKDSERETIRISRPPGRRWGRRASIDAATESFQDDRVLARPRDLCAWNDWKTLEGKDDIRGHAGEPTRWARSRCGWAIAQARTPPKRNFSPSPPPPSLSLSLFFFFFFFFLLFFPVCSKAGSLQDWGRAGLRAHKRLKDGFSADAVDYRGRTQGPRGAAWVSARPLGVPASFR